MNIDISLVIRKTEHFCVFLLISYFLYTIIKNISHKKSLTYVWVLFLCLLIGVLDEFSQSFMQGRTSSVIDVIIDFSGALFFLIIRELTELFDKVVKFILGVILKTRNNNVEQSKKNIE